jgi:hypothetical protein
MPPDFWMHQLAVTQAPGLDANAVRQRVQGLLAAPAAEGQA